MAETGRWMRRSAASGLMMLMLLLATGCPRPQTHPSTPAAAAAPLTTHITTARRQSSYIRLATAGAGVVRLGALQRAGEAVGPALQWQVFAERGRQAVTRSPAAEQLLGSPVVTIDEGSILVPATALPTQGQETAAFQLEPGSAVWLRVSVPLTAESGEYEIAVEMSPATPERQGRSAPVAPVSATTTAPSASEKEGIHPSEATTSVPVAPETPTVETMPAATVPALAAHAPVAAHWQVRVSVSDITLPAAPAVLTVATTSTAELAALYPERFGALQATYLDRGDSEQQEAVERLDALVRAAHAQGVALFVEDLGPALRLDDVGQVSLDWDAYDRTMFPYMDGSAFEDRVGQPVWMAPLPPRRIRDTPVQLRQYWQACLEHFRQKGWNAVPVLLHPVLMEGGEEDRQDGRRGRALAALRGLADPAAVGVRPGVYREEKLEQPAFWTLDDADRQVPPAGVLATAGSVRVWPWMIQARQVRGMIWRHAVGGGGLPAPASGELPLLQVEKQGILPSVRLAWLTAGLNDSAHFALLRQRSDPLVAAEVLAGVAGRTGLAESPSTGPEQPWRGGPAGYLYAGWPEDPKLWETLPGMIDRLIEANNPGAAVQASPDDPLYLAAKMWLAQAHRPVARTSGYQFKLDAGREGSLLETSVGLTVENPVRVDAALDVNWLLLPGNVQVAKAPPLELPSHALVTHTLRATGHLDTIAEPAQAYEMQLRERAGGALLSLPVMLPVARILTAHDALKIDGQANDWPQDPRERRGAYSPMVVARRYANRPDLLAGGVALDRSPAVARWRYDGEWVYGFIECPQATTSDERTSDWPGGGMTSSERRWWGSDGVQVQISGGPRLMAGARVVQIGIKPSGTVLVRQTTIVPGEPLRWEEGSPTGRTLRYGIRADGKGYRVELAIPRAWLGREFDRDPNLPLWRVNVLRHQEIGHVSTSWCGPMIDDADLAMMGVMAGTGE